VREGRTFVAMNTHGTPTAAFVSNPNWQFPAAGCDAAVMNAAGAAQIGALDADQLAVQLVGDSLYTNPLMLGYAWQKGRVPLSLAALLRAIELNNVQVENNKLAFEWGRRAAHDLAAVQALLKPAAPGSSVIEFVRKTTDLDAIIATRVEFLTGYQNAAYAQRYKAFVEKVRAAETPQNSKKLTEAVARYLFKLMAYKDEYEVARLHTDPGFLAKVATQFEGDYTLNYHLAPPLTAKKNDKGEMQKSKFGPWMQTGFRLLARLKGLRGTALDVFGRTEERKTERALIGQYQASIDEVLRTLSASNLALATDIARIPEDIRGYGHVKERHLRAAQPKWAALMAEWRSGGQRRAA
jgi:indolepyruvate ferredoxin oxidoreductase